MRLKQAPRTCRSRSLALWLALLALVPASPFRADAGLARSAVPGAVGTTATPARRHLAAAGDKKQVPKPADEPRYKPGAESNGNKDDDSGSDGGFLEGCLNSCLSGIFESICTPSKPSASAAPSPALSAPPAASTLAVLSEGSAWIVGDRGWLVVAVPGDSVMLFESHAERGRPEVDAGHLAAGTPVVIVETLTRADGTELRVRPVDALEPLGWIPGSALSRTPPTTAVAPAPSAVPPVAAPAAPAGSHYQPPAGPIRSGLQLVVGAGTWGNGDLRDEFKELGFRGALGYQSYPHGSLLIGAGAGVRSFSGNARVNYLTPTTLDIPGASEFVVCDIAALAGQRHGRRPGFGFSWSAGPALFYVHELSDVRTFAIATDTTGAELLGRRDETLGRWTGGGVASVTLDWTVAPEAEVGLRIDGFYAAWDGKGVKSLTSEFIHAPLRGFDVGIYVNFPFR